MTTTNFLAVTCWCFASILGIARHYHYINIERLQLGKKKQNIYRYFMNDIGDESIILIVPLREKFNTQEKEALKRQVNLYTYGVYTLVLISVVMFLIF